MPATNDNRYDRRSGPRDRRLRVGDSEREAVAEILRQQHVVGRLDSDEFQERLERCLAAKTYAELDELVADFPSAEAEQRRAGRAWRWRPWPFAFLPLALIAVIIALSGGHLVWLAFPLFFFFVVRPFLWRSWRPGYGRGFGACGPRHTTRTGTRASREHAAVGDRFLRARYERSALTTRRHLVSTRAPTGSAAPSSANRLNRHLVELDRRAPLARPGIHVPGQTRPPREPG